MLERSSYFLFVKNSDLKQIRTWLNTPKHARISNVPIEAYIRNDECSFGLCQIIDLDGYLCTVRQQDFDSKEFKDPEMFNLTAEVLVGTIPDEKFATAIDTKESVDSDNLHKFMYRKSTHEADMATIVSESCVPRGFFTYSTQWTNSLHPN